MHFSKNCSTIIAKVLAIVLNASSRYYINAPPFDPFVRLFFIA